jgi:hypothetical protein
MNRRGFFGTLVAAVAAGAEYDTDRVLWTRKKLISIPKPKARAPILIAEEALGSIYFRNVGSAPVLFKHQNYSFPWALETGGHIAFSPQMASELLIFNPSDQTASVQIFGLS